MSAKRSKRVPAGEVRVCSKTIPVYDVQSPKFMGRSFAEGFIQVSPGQLPQTYYTTVLHEVLHTIGTDFSISELAKESVVGPLSMALFSFIRDNPDLVKRIQAS